MNVDADEVAKFESLAHRWWDPESEFKPLHDINEIRLRFIDDNASLAGRKVVDVGCGGGILTESMAALAADVTGIDPAHGSLTVAKLHALETGIEDRIRYVETTPEAFAEEEGESFDVVVAMEMLEHVPDPGSTVAALAALTAPGGHVFLSTINRHPKAYLLAVLGAEYVLNLLPKGTHDYAKFIKPSELCRALREAGLIVEDLAGYTYNPFTRRCRLTTDVDVNYLVHARKPD